MNKRQHIVQQQFLNNEAAVFKRLKTVYGQSSNDINSRIQELDIEIAGLQSVWDNFEGSEKEREQLRSQIQSKIYQKQYQEAIGGQVDDILQSLQNNAYKSISEYLEKSYEEGFIGTMYSLQGQGIPLIMPLDQEAMVRAVQLDSKISKGLYNHLGENVGMLKKHITAQVSRGIASGYSYEQVAQQLAFKMTGTYNNPGGALAYAMRIARTEGHRIQVQGAIDACYKAKDIGADVVKQWDSTLDSKTRKSHQDVDGEIRELDEAFSNGLMFPGDPAGGAAEVVNCRCALLERARWALTEKVNQNTGEVYWEDDTFTKMNNFTKKLETFDKPEDYKDFKKAFFSTENVQFMNYHEQLAKKYGTNNFERLISSMSDREYSRYITVQENSPVYNKNKASQLTNSANGVIMTPKNSQDTNYNYILSAAQKRNVDYNPVYNHTKQLTDDEIISALSGGDMTQGSCASVGLAYIGQKQGWEVLDFRDGHSRRVFGLTTNLDKLSKMEGIKAIRAQGACSMTVGNRLVKQCEPGKEYYLCVGRHASVVRKTTDGTLQYLELQSKNKSGWTDFDGNPRYTLHTRFGCSNTKSNSEVYDFMIDLEESDFTSNDDFRTLLGYLNTSENEQRKGSSGTIK